MNKTLYYVSIGTLALFLGIMIYGLYLLAFPFKTLDADQPFPVTTKTVVAGEKLEFTAKVCRYTSVVATVSQQLVGENLVYLPTHPSRVSKGCGTFKSSVLVPSDTPAGRYKLVSSAKYPINPLRTITVTTETQEFDVVKPIAILPNGQVAFLSGTQVFQGGETSPFTNTSTVQNNNVTAQTKPSPPPGFVRQLLSTLGL